jgi:DHA1 family bicyclomycin/chloramphenicol resistance-like MFS transporter
MSPLLIILFIALLLGVQPVTTDLYLPALPALTQALSASITQAQLTFSIMLLAFGSSQLVWGPISDKHGRRPVLLAGLGLYTLASLACFLAPTIEALLVARAFQGAAMGAGVMCARAMVRDLYAPVDGARIMSKGLSGLGVLACISPVLGGFLTQAVGWRGPMAAVMVFGALSLILVAFYFKETLAKPNPKALELSNLLATWRRILGSPVFWTFCALSALSYGILVLYLVSSSFIYLNIFGWSKAQYGLTLFVNSLVYICGTFVGRRLLARQGMAKAIAIGAAFTLAGGLVVGVAAMQGHLSPFVIIGAFTLVMIGHGIHQPFGQAGAVGPFPQAAGTASALNGFIMMVMGFFIVRWLSGAMDGTPNPLAYSSMGLSVLIALLAWTAVQRFGSHFVLPRR